MLLALALKGLFVALGLVATVQFVLLPLAVDLYRQRLFNLRRELYLLMVDGGVAPSEPAYQHLLLTMNALLRYAHLATFLRGLFGALGTRGPTKSWSAEVDATFEAMTDESAREALRDLRKRLEKEVLWHMMRSSPSLWVFLILAFCLSLVALPFLKMVNMLRHRAGHLRAKAEQMKQRASSDLYSSLENDAGRLCGFDNHDRIAA
jgi:hypothetical protein